MWKKVNLRSYLAVCIFLLVVAFILQLMQGKDCSWDGCYSTDRVTIIGALFGLPAYILELEILFGIVLWAIKAKRSL